MYMFFNILHIYAIVSYITLCCCCCFICYVICGVTKMLCYILQQCYVISYVICYDTCCVIYYASLCYIVLYYTVLRYIVLFYTISYIYIQLYTHLLLHMRFPNWTQQRWKLSSLGPAIWARCKDGGIILNICHSLKSASASFLPTRV